MLAGLPRLTLPGHPGRRWEPKRLRLRLLATAGRRTLLHLPAAGRWTHLLIHMVTTLEALPEPGG